MYVHGMQYHLDGLKNLCSYIRLKRTREKYMDNSGFYSAFLCVNSLYENAIKKTIHR